MQNCIFCKIAAGQIPAKIAYKDENMVIFNDIEPKANKHYLLICTEHFATLEEMNSNQAQMLAACLKKLPELKELLGLEDGYRLVINQGQNAGQTVFHLHVHILGGQKMQWNPA